MPTRYLLISGKTLIDLTEQLNTACGELGRVVFIEKTKTGYNALIDTYALVVATLEDVMGAEVMEAERREFNQELLKNAVIKTSKTL